MKYALLVFLGGCSYGILSTIVKIAYAAGLTPAEVCGGQGFFGMLLLWMAALRHGGFPLSVRRALTLICCGLPIGLTTMFYYTALQTVTASFAIILLFQFVWVSTAIDCVFSRRLPDRQKVAAIAILLPGSVLAAGLVGSSDSISLTSGVLWGLASAVSYSFVLLVSGTVGCEVPPVLKSALMSVGAATVIFAFMPPTFLLSLGSLAAAAPYGILWHCTAAASLFHRHPAHWTVARQHPDFVGASHGHPHGLLRPWRAHRSRAVARRRPDLPRRDRGESQDKGLRSCPFR